MGYANVLVARDGRYVTITMNRPERRNALSLDHMRDLLGAFRETAATDALGITLAGAGPVFSAGHDFADLAGASYASVRRAVTSLSPPRVRGSPRPEERAAGSATPRSFQWPAASAASGPWSWP